MFSVIFEVNRKPDKADAYLDLAMGLKPVLRGIDGFIDNERFESQLRPGWLLSHSTWRDEKSVIRWRTEQKHHFTQERGRFEIFSDYHLRVGEITADTAPPVPLIQQRFDESQIGAARYVTLTELTVDEAEIDARAKTLAQDLGVPEHDPALLDRDIYKSISAIYPDDRAYRPGKLALLLTWRSAESARWTPKPGERRHRSIRVVRDYGMFDRREAPQYYDDVKDARPTLHPQPRADTRA